MAGPEAHPIGLVETAGVAENIAENAVVDAPAENDVPDGRDAEAETANPFSEVQGIALGQKRFEHTRFGPWRRWVRLESWEKTFLIICYIALIVSLGMTVYKFAKGDMSDEDTVYGIILVIATGFSFFYVATGVHQELPHNMVALAITNGILWGYVIINYVNYTRDEKKYYSGKLVRLIFTSVFTLVLVPLAAYLAKRYHSRRTLITFVVNSVNEEVLRMAARHFTFTSAVTFDLQLQANFLILVLKDSVRHTATGEWAILVVGIVLTIVWTSLGRFSVRRESSKFLLLFVILTLPNLAYAAFQFQQLFKTNSATQIFKLTILSGVSAVVVRLCLLVLTYFVYKDFGKGLKEHIYRYDNENTGRPVIASSGVDPEAQEEPRLPNRAQIQRGDSL